MNITPKLAYRHAGYPANTALDTSKVYPATIATNQPNYKKRGLVFVDCPNGAPEMLLSRAQYEVVA